MERQENLVEQYFSLGLQQREILTFLRSLHNIDISLRTLKRILRKLNLRRRKNYTNIHQVIRFIEQKWIHLKCMQNGFVVTQNVVRELLKLLDPDGVEIRKRKRLRRRQYSSKGANFVWHMDSYDKLKRYGICINGCIDGFSTPFPHNSNIDFRMGAETKIKMLNSAQPQAGMV
ncbi:hypothetical protein NQ315_016252 [Exocentrus adspersus]|uniref:Integrase core domain-containing protein n=1 Tax=Exocentrus adspersus TaxID=1586481 RepID=A0AAV8VIY9_9CUCU|nr:hypothetical protein NQ315_016252 [Exocentrus adspersus]